MESANEEKREDGRRLCHESRRVVSSFAIFSDRLIANKNLSAGAASIVKTTYLVALSAKADFTCKSPTQ
jgi:hypothetical protein